MDSLTQITLGAAVGEAILGKRVGNKAAFWGAVCGTIPDLDVMLNPLFSEATQLAIHRGFSHSILFSIIAAPVLGLLFSKFHRKDNVSWKSWSLLAFLSLFTHPILDSFTNYGTQLFNPFSDYQVAFNTIFVIDPLYTLPFLVLLIITLFQKRNSKNRKIFRYLGLGISSLYLAFTVINKLYINSVFENQAELQGIKFEKYMTAPTPFNNILWRGLFKTKYGYYEGFYSLFDQTDEIKFNFIQINDEPIKEIEHTYAIQKLLWFSGKYFTITERENSYFFNDLRFGSLNGWVESSEDYVFSFRIINDNGEIKINREFPNFEIDGEILSIFWDRIKGI